MDEAIEKIEVKTTTVRVPVDQHTNVRRKLLDRRGSMTLKEAGLLGFELFLEADEEKLQEVAERFKARYGVSIKDVPSGI